MSKLCIFNKELVCSDCGECNTCDLNSNKRCNNCGKCLEMEGYDIKAIEIDDIFESDNDIDEYHELNELHSEANNTLNEDNELWDYIDDVKELKDLLEDEKELNIYEEFPGLIVYKKEENNLSDEKGE